MTRTGEVRIGSGAGFAGDRFEPAIELAERGGLDALVFECLAERTIALAQLAIADGQGPGYDPLLLERVRTTLLPALRSGTVLITNAGAAAPLAAAHAVRDLAGALGERGVVVAAVTGDDVLDRLDLASARVDGTDSSLLELGDRIVSANAYLGAAGVVEALDADPAVVITGRTSDAALFLAPLVHRHRWAMDDLDRIAAGTLVGHLLECAGQLTGGYFADGGRKQVPGLARLGFPLARVSADGSARLTKLSGTGGRIDQMTVLEQLLYEVHDPAAYLTPDVVVDLSHVLVHEVASDEVSVSGAVGHPRPDQLKVTVGVRDGFQGDGEISYAGPGCLDRARLAADVVSERWRDVHQLGDVALESHLIGFNACRPFYDPGDVEVPEVRLRMSVRSLDPRPARVLAREVEALYTNGPAGGGGVTTRVRSTLGVVSTMIDRSAAEQKVHVLS